MGKRKTHHGPQTIARNPDKAAERLLIATGILAGCILISVLSIHYAPRQEVPPAKTDLYSSYRWGNCDTHPGQCSREYSTSDTTTLIRHRPCMAGLNCPCSEALNGTGATIIYTFSGFNDRCQYRRYVGLRDAQAEYVYGRVAREYEDLARAGIDPLRLEKVVTSLSQMSSGNIGELVALKRPDLEARYWNDMKTFVQHNPKSAPPKKLQDLFKRWYKHDTTIVAANTKTPELPVLGDFKWTIHKHSQLDFSQRYMSRPFYAGGQPWRLVYYPQSDWDKTHFAIYLTPVASQHSRPGWLRQVSFNVRVHGHDSPSQSIWANWNHTYSALDEDCASGFSHFKEHAILHMPGRGYLRNDTLEIRAIVRLNALANMGPIKDVSRQAYGIAGLAGGVRSILRDAISPAADYKPLALRLRETGVMSVAEALQPSTQHLDGFWAWCARLPRQAASAQLYHSHLKLLLMASGLAVILSLARSIHTYVRKGGFVDPEDSGARLAFPGWDTVCSCQLLVFSLAARAVLTLPAALSLVAHVLSSGAPPMQASAAAHRATRLRHMLRTLRLFGLAVAVDMLLTGGGIKLLLPTLLDYLLDLKDPQLLALLDGASCVAFMSSLLLDCLLHHRSAAFMQGPLMHFLRAGEVELWPGRDLLPHWKLAPETLHANTCMVIFFTAAMLVIYPRMRPSLASLIGVLLFLGAGWVPSFVWRVLYGVVTGLPGDVPEGNTWSQLAVDNLVHAPVIKALQAVEYAGCCLQSCLRSPSSTAPAAKAKGLEDEGGKSRTSAKEDAVEVPKVTKGGASPTAAKAKHPGSKTGAQKRSKQKPEAKKVAQGPIAQPQKRSAGQRCVDISCQPSDAAATLQLSPGVALVHASDSERGIMKAIDDSELENTLPCIEPQQIVESREGPAKIRTAKQKGLKAPDPANLQHLTRSSSSSLSGRASPAWDLSDRIAEETASHCGTEEAAVSEPITQTVTPELTPVKPGTDALPGASGPSLIRLSSSPARGQGSRAAQSHSMPPPLESLMPMTGHQQHSVKDASAEDLLLALLRASTPAKDARLGSAACRHAASGAGQPAREAGSVLGDAMPYLAAAANSASAPLQQVPNKDLEALEDQTCVMCWEKPRQATLAPCGHRALCAPCTELLLRRGKALCPICRRGVQSYILREFEV